MSYAYHQQRRGRQQVPPQNSALDYSDSDRTDRTDYTPYSQGSNYYGGGDGQYYYEEGGNPLDYSDSDRTDRTPYSYYSEDQSYQGQDPRGSFNSGIVSAPGRRNGSFNSGYYNDAQSVQSYGGDNASQASSYSRSRQGNQRYQNDNVSVCVSTSATTVADGGRGRCPYQIGFHVQNVGKQMMTSKRIIHFRFGFANAQALAKGQAGVDCRGHEHDLIITWSITGGKRQIAIDGREIQYAAGKRKNSARRADLMEAAWRMSDHIFELKLYAYPPKSGSPEKRNPKWKQYSLAIDGRSFFELPEIFDLGLRGMGTGRLPNTISRGSDWDQTSVVSSKAAPSSIASTQYSDQSSVKSSIQSRIEEQRKLMNSKKQGATSVNKSRPRYANSNSSVTSDPASESSNLMSFRSLRLSQDQEDDSELFSSGVFSSAPSELREVRDRQSAAESTGDNRMEQKRHSASTSECSSAIVPQQYKQPQKNNQSKCSPATSESSTNHIVTSQVQKQLPPQQSNVQGQDVASHMMLASSQRPPTIEEITQALVPSVSVSPKDAVQVHYQQQNLPVTHQPRALPPSNNQLDIPPQQTLDSSSSYHQNQSTNNVQRSAQPSSGSSHYQSHYTHNNQRSEQQSRPVKNQPHPTNYSQRSSQPSSNSHYQNHSSNNNSQRSAQPSHYQNHSSNNNQRNARPASGSSHYQTYPTSNNQGGAHPRENSSTQYQSHPNNSNRGSAPGQPPQPSPDKSNSDNLPKGMNKFAFF